VAMESSRKEIIKEPKLGRVAQPEEIACVVALLLRADASFVTVGDLAVIAVIRSVFAHDRYAALTNEGAHRGCLPHTRSCGFPSRSVACPGTEGAVLCVFELHDEGGCKLRHRACPGGR